MSSFSKKTLLTCAISLSLLSIILLYFSNKPIPPLQEKTYIAEEDGEVKFLDALRSSQKYVWIGSYKLHNNLPNRSSILNCLSDLSQHKIPTFVFLESRLSKEEKRFQTGEKLKDNRSLDLDFRKTKVNIISDVQNFYNINFKVFLNESYLIVGTTNFDVKHREAVQRDFFIVSKDSALMNEAKEVLNNVQSNKPIQWSKYLVTSIPPKSTKLSWGPAQHRAHLEEIIRLAKTSIQIYQQDIQDESITDALIGKIKKGVKVRIIMSHHPFSKQHKNKSLPNLMRIARSGGLIRLTGRKNYKNNIPLHIHAKVMIVDEGSSRQMMYLGSANFYPKVLDPKQKNLNLGIITTDERYIVPVAEVFESDWLLHHEHQL